MISVNNDFHKVANGQIIPLEAGLYVSFTKDIDDTLGWFVLDSSELDRDMLALDDKYTPMQKWDYYEYIDFTDRLVSLDYERSVEFPYNTQSALADFTLDNYDDYFTPGSQSAIDNYNVPGRPVKISCGFKGFGLLPQFVGITRKMPTVEQKSATASYHAVDFLSAIAEQSLTDIIDMREVRTDQVLAKIVQQFGVLPTQYRFDPGANIIPFVFFDVGQNAGEAIQKLVQAENGKFWMDEMGMLRFTRRDFDTGAPVAVIDDYSIINARSGSYSDIINHIVISCDLREVQEFQTIYQKTPHGESADTNWVVPANSSITRKLTLEDPCYSVVTPTLGRASSVSWFTAIDSNMDEVNSDVAVVDEQLTNNSYIVTIQNDNNFAVEVDYLTLWGEPAKVYDHLDYEAYEDVSVDTYGDHRLTIADNPFFQSYDQAVAFADDIINQRAFYNNIMTLDIKGDFSIQLGDVIEIQGKYAGYWQIDSIKYYMEWGLLETTIVVHSVPQYSWFILDDDELDGSKILG